MKGDNITDENEGNVEYSNEYIKCKNIQNRDSTKMY